MEIVRIYHWAMPTELHERFRSDWERITRDVALSLGQTMATLFQLKGGDFISVTRWPDEATYKEWVAWIMQSEEGKLYYQYEKERGEPLVVLP